MMNRVRQKGFTLIELLVVVTIIGILAALAIPGLLTALDRARQTSSAALVRSFGVAIEAYGTESHGYPIATNINDLIPLLNPYSATLRPLDEWKHHLGYESSGTHYSVECFGKDGVNGIEISPLTRYNFDLDILYSDGVFVGGIE